MHLRNIYKERLKGPARLSRLFFALVHNYEKRNDKVLKIMYVIFNGNILQADIRLDKLVYKI